MAININNPAASAFSDLLSLALQMGSQAQERRWRSEEAERDRQFRESQVYLQNMLNQEGRIIDDIFAAEEDAAKFGIDITEPINRLAQFQKQNATANAQSLLNLNQSIKDDRISQLISIRSDIGEQKGLFSQGERLGDMLDTNTDNILDDTEILQFEELERLRKNDPDYVLPEAFVHGARARLSDPEVQLTKLQLAGEKTRQEELKLKAIREQEIFRQRGVAFEQATTESEFALIDRYRGENLSTMTGKISPSDYGIASHFHDMFKNLSRPEIMALIEQTPQEYEDIVPQDIDYSDFQNAIAPQAAAIIATDILNSTDMMDALGLTSEDVATGSPKFQGVVISGLQNAMVGFEQNPNYKFKSEIEVTQAKVLEAQSQAVLEQDLHTSMLQAGPTIKATFTDKDGEINDEMIEAIADETDIEKSKVQSIINSLIVQQDPTTLALMMSESEDYQKVLKSAGLGTLASVVASAGKKKAQSRKKYKPATRITQSRAKEIKDIAKHRQESNKFADRIQKKHSDVLADPLNYTGAVGWADGEQIPIPIISLKLQQLSLDLLQTETAQEADAIRARMIELEHLLDTATESMKKG